MLYRNLGYQWAIPTVDGLGVCVAAQGINLYSALTKERQSNLPQNAQRLFDPQLYLGQLDSEDCEPVARRLSTFSWLNPKIAQYDGQGVREWEQKALENADWPCRLPQDRDSIQERIRDCFQFQNDFGVTAFIIPGPLTKDPESDFSCEITWIDEGLHVHGDFPNKPVYATLAISDMCLIHREPEESDLLELITDNLSARQSTLDGVYILLEQTAPSDSGYLMNSRVARALLRLCYDLGTRANLAVIVNYVDVFGLVCLSVGAQGFCVAPTTKGRRLCFDDFESRGGGGAFPRFYSHSLLLNLLPKRDIEDKIAKKRMLRYLEADESPLSQDLFDALKNNRRVESVPNWHERVNNTQTSRQQYLELILRANDDLMASNEPIPHILAWLQDAERDASYLVDRFSDDSLSADHRHIKVWRSAFERFVEENNLLE